MTGCQNTGYWTQVPVPKNDTESNTESGTVG